MRTFLLGAAVLALWGCANNDGAEQRSGTGGAGQVESAESQRDPESTGEYWEPSTEKARESRAESDETVYDESATGGSGLNESVTNEEGTWDTQAEPGGDEPRVPPNGGERPEADSEVIREGVNDPEQ